MMMGRERNASDVWITLLSDGVSYWDGGGAFGLVPRVKWTKLLPPDEMNRVPQELRSVLIHADGQRILVDCGVGNKLNDLLAAQYEVRRPQGTLLDDLKRQGLEPEEIDIVILTHLHGDHSGWATECVEHGTGMRYQPTFPNAHYYVQGQEFEDATHTNERTRNTYFAENFVPLMEHGVLTLLDGPTDITPSVRVAPTPGHTAGHQSVIVQRRQGAGENGGEESLSPTVSPPAYADVPVLILGDMATFMIQFERLAWLTAYDVLPLQTIETKRYWQKWALERQALLISPHDTQTPSGVLRKDERGFLQVAQATASNS
jgi:glyoxylase-like metal-dependent hydrolase (beta-lactamase superfamily II)